MVVSVKELQMSYALKFEPNVALQNARKTVKAEFIAVKQTVASGTNKSPVGSFRADFNSKSTAEKPQRNR
jgi:hypothetical protein